MTAETRERLRQAINDARRDAIARDDARFGVKHCPMCGCHPDERTTGCRTCGERHRARARRDATPPDMLREMWRQNRERARALRRQTA